MEHTNLGVKPLGRMGVISATVEAETAALRAFGKETRAIGPVNNMTGARMLRIAQLKHCRRMDAIHGTKTEKAMAALFVTLKLPA